MYLEESVAICSTEQYVLLYTVLLHFSYTATLTKLSN